MSSILNNLRDPSWWFTAFFVAIIASVIAGFLKERIAIWLSWTFSGLDSWKKARQARRRELIEALVANDTYFIIALLRAVISLLAFALITILYVSAPILLVSIPETSELLVKLDPGYFVLKVIAPILGTLNVVVGYTVSTRLSIVTDAIREYRKRKKLPRLL